MVGGTELGFSGSVFIEVDEIEEMLERAGNLGQFGPPPSANLARSVRWASLTGAGTKTGTSAGNAIATADAGHNLLTADQDDVLICLPSNYGNETVTCDLAGVHIFGFGLGQCRGISFTVSADHVEIAGFQVDDTSVATLIAITGDWAWIHHNFIYPLSNTNTKGVLLDSANYCVIEYNEMEGSGSTSVTGIHISSASATTYNTVRYNVITQCTAEGILIGNAACASNRIYKNISMENLYGIRLTAGNNNYIANNVLKGNTALDYDDAGTNTRAVNNNGVFISATHTRTNANATSEVDVTTNVDVPRAGKLAINCDVSDFSDGGLITVRAENTSGDVLAIDTFLVGADEKMPSLEFWVDSGANKFDLTIQTSVAVAANRDMLYEVIFGDG